MINDIIHLSFLRLEDSFVIKLAMRLIIKKWQEIASVCHKTSMTHTHTKITESELANLNRLVREDKNKSFFK
jgi:hypothetical protein